MNSQIVETSIRSDATVEVGYFMTDEVAPYEWRRLAVYDCIEDAIEHLRYWQGWVDSRTQMWKPVDIFENIMDEDYILTTEKQVAVNLVRAAMAEVDKIPSDSTFQTDVDTRFQSILKIARLWIEINQTFPK